MKKYLLSIFIFIGGLGYLKAQPGIGGTPPSFKYTNELRTSDIFSILRIGIEDLNIQRLEYEDGIAEKNGSPLRVAETLPVEVDIRYSGEWTTLPDLQKIWRQTIVAPDAKGIIISYKDFYLPEGSQLFIYNKDKTLVLGAYTKETNPNGGVFSNQVIYDEEITLEYVASAISDEEPRLIIEDIGYLYRNRNTITEDKNSKLRAKSDACMININCNEGRNWQNHKRGVVRILTKVGSSWYSCSGSLLNNTAYDEKPYILTAYHCFFMDRGVSDPATTQFYFNDEYLGCEDDEDSLVEHPFVGAYMRVFTPLHEGSDGVLLELINPVPENFNPYYNGWDATNTVSSSGVVIHHPNGDVKKISTYNTRIESFTWNENGSVGVADAHWNVIYSPTQNGHAVTQGGSSGAPLFNSNGLIIGSLTGGSSYCNSPYSPDQFGKFAYHFNRIQGEDKQMKEYLDPLNTGVLTLRGYDPLDTIPVFPGDDGVNMIVFHDTEMNEICINVRHLIRKLQIFDMTGRIVYRKNNYDSSTETVSSAGWPKGVYNISVKTDEGRFSDKIVIN